MGAIIYLMGIEGPKSPHVAKRKEAMPHKEKWEDKIDYRLHNLGLDRGSVKGEVLDVGGYQGEFAALVKANKLPAHVRVLEPVFKSSYPDIEGDYVRASAQDMQGIEDESIDLLVAHNSIPALFIYEEANIEQSQDDLKRSFSEVVRVLRKGGRARLGPITFEGKSDTHRILKQSLEQNLIELAKQESVQASLIPNGQTESISDSEPRSEIMVPVFYVSIEKAR